VHAVDDEHDTPFNSLATVPAGAGVVSIDQLVPFQISANASDLFALA
jgi:hypothetical protein